MYDHVHMRRPLILVHIFGLKPMHCNRRIFNYIHWFYSRFIISYFVWFIISQYIEIYKIFDEDISTLVSNLSISLLYLATLFKILVINGKKIDDLIKKVGKNERDTLRSEDEKLKHIFIRNVHINNNLITFSTSITFLTLCNYYVGPFLEEINAEPKHVSFAEDNTTRIYPVRSLPLSSWIPFNRYKYYSLSYAYHVFSATIGGFSTLCVDVLFFSLITFGTGQLKEIQYYFEHGLSKCGADHENCCVKSNLRSFIKIHQDIIRFGYLFNYFY